MDIGTRLKAVREAHGLSQRELAKRAGMTNASVSLIEQNRVSPSVSSLKKILDSIPMSMVEFFTQEQAEQSAKYVFTASEQPDVGSQDICMRLMGAGVNNRQISLLYETYQPGGDTGAEMYRHEGEECGLVISGTIELTISDQIHTLRPGDGYYFPSTLEHRFRNPGQTEAVIVSANTPPSW